MRRTATAPGTSCPTLLEWCVGSLTAHIELISMEGVCEMGLMVYCSYLRRPESLAICGCNCTAALSPPLLF